MGYISNSRGEEIDLLFGVENSKAEPQRAAMRCAECIVGKRCAMVACAQAKSAIREHVSHAVGGEPIYVEQKHAALALVVDGHFFDGGELIIGSSPELALVACDGVEPKAFDKFNTRYKPRYCRCAECAALVSFGAFVAHRKLERVNSVAALGKG